MGHGLKTFELCAVTFSGKGCNECVSVFGESGVTGYLNVTKCFSNNEKIPCSSSNRRNQ